MQIHTFKPQITIMRILFLALGFFVVFGAQAQEGELLDFNAVDSLYREDQFYLGVTYNLLQDKPNGIRQNKISLGMSAGILRDMPINKRRTWAIAAGLGYSFHNYNHNVQMTKIGDSDVVYTLFTPETYYSKNKLILHYVDIPLELRWRTSTPESHKFWRVYTGFKASYLFYDQYKYRGEGPDYTISHNDDLRKWVYGVYLAAGYNTWNLNVYYNLNTLYSDGHLNGQPMGLRSLNVGLMFYIL